MGGLFETKRMKKHMEQCAVCQAAHAAEGVDSAACCDEYSDMLENLVDFENNKGPWEDREDWQMCPACDGAVPFGGMAPAREGKLGSEEIEITRKIGGRLIRLLNLVENAARGGKVKSDEGELSGLQSALYDACAERPADSEAR